MKSKSEFEKLYKDNILPVQIYCDEIYKENDFESCFCNLTALIGKMESKIDPISNRDLEWILINLPMKLISASESLNKLKLSFEVVKLKLKEKKKSDITEEDIEEYQILKVIYENLISRVETKISLSKELIMGAKKVWDSRRSTENVNPISENDLPEYPSNYIK